MCLNVHDAFLWSESNPSGLGTQPQVQVSPQNIGVHEGETLRLYCRATGSPTPKLTWLKNGGQIPPQVRHLLLSRCLSDDFNMDRFRLYLLSVYLALQGVSGADGTSSYCVSFCDCFSILTIYLYSSLPSVCLLPPFFLILPCSDVCSGHSLSRFPSV